MASCIFLALASQPLEKLLHIRPQLQWGPQIKFSLFFLPSWRAMCWGVGRDALREGPALSPALPLGPPPLVPTSGRGTDVWLVTSDGLAQSLYLFFQGHCGCQGPSVSFPHLSKLSCSQTSSPHGVLLCMEGCQQILTFPIPLAVHPLSTSGGFSKRTPHHSSTHTPILAHMAGMQVVSWVYRLGSIGFLFLLCWCGASWIIQWRHLPLGLDKEGHASSLSGSFIPPPFSQNKQHEGVFPGESGGDIAPPPPNMDIHPGTYQLP